MAHRLWAASAIAALGCAAGDLILPDTRAPAALVIESGDDQTGTAGTALPEPLVVRVTDAAERSVEGATVEFSPTGDAAIVPASAVTGADGRASASWTLSGDPGTQTATARVLDEGVAVGLSVTFTATAQPGVQRRPTETRIGTDPDPSDEGEAVTIVVRVRASSGGDRPRGSVVFYDQSSSCGDGALLGQIELDDDGEGSLTTTSLAVGFHTIRGCYSGSASFAPSDDTASQTVRED